MKKEKDHLLYVKSEFTTCRFKIFSDLHLATICVFCSHTQLSNKRNFAFHERCHPPPQPDYVMENLPQSASFLDPVHIGSITRQPRVWILGITVGTLFLVEHCRHHPQYAKQEQFVLWGQNRKMQGHIWWMLWYKLWSVWISNYAQWD